MSTQSHSFDPQQWCEPHIREVHAYVPGEQPSRREWTKLNTNENPFPPSPKVKAAIEAAVEGLAFYPQPDSARLREAVALHHGLSSDQVLAGNGSDDVLNLLIRVFGGRDRPVGAMDPSYSLYPVLCRIQNAPFHVIPYDSTMKLPVEAVAKSGVNLFFLTSPNAPTGVGYTTSELTQVAETFPGILVIDEAYAAFASEDAIPLLEEFPNVVITRSFSKSHGLAGLRVGYALGSPQVIELLDRVRDSYNLDALAQAGAIAALQDTDYLKTTVQAVIGLREDHRRFLEKLGWATFPSQSNFLCARPIDGRGRSGKEVAADCFGFLKEQKILVRYFPRQPLVSSYLRISVGTRQQMQNLQDHLLSWIEGTKG